MAAQKKRHFVRGARLNGMICDFTGSMLLARHRERGEVGKRNSVGRETMRGGGGVKKRSIKSATVSLTLP